MEQKHPEAERAVSPDAAGEKGCERIRIADGQDTRKGCIRPTTRPAWSVMTPLRSSPESRRKMESLKAHVI